MKVRPEIKPITFGELMTLKCKVCINARRVNNETLRLFDVEAPVPDYNISIKYDNGNNISYDDFMRCLIAGKYLIIENIQAAKNTTVKAFRIDNTSGNIPQSSTSIIMDSLSYMDVSFSGKYAEFSFNIIWQANMRYEFQRI